MEVWVRLIPLHTRQDTSECSREVWVRDLVELLFCLLLQDIKSSLQGKPDEILGGEGVGLVTCGGLASTSGGNGNIRFMLRRLGFAPELGDPLESSGNLPFILRKSVVELGSIEKQCLYSKQ